MAVVEMITYIFFKLSVFLLFLLRFRQNLQRAHYPIMVNNMLANEYLAFDIPAQASSLESI